MCLHHAHYVFPKKKNLSVHYLPTMCARTPMAHHQQRGHYMGPHGCANTCIVTKCSPKPISEVTQGFPKNSKC